MSIRRGRHGAVEILTLDRPTKRNAMDQQMVAGIGGTVLDVEADPDIRALVVTGAGSAFCAGMDLNRVGTATSRGSTEQVEAFRTFMELGCAKPVVAAVNGPAVAGGFELMLACDLVVAADDAQLGLPEVRRGLVPGAGGTLLPRRVPRAIALELGLTGRPITARRAFEIGLVNRVVPEADVMSTAVGLAETVASNSPGAVRATRRLMDHAQDLSLTDNWTQIRAVASHALASPDAVEGARAFLEKRDPVWTAPST